MIILSRRAVTASLIALPSLAACGVPESVDQNTIWARTMTALEEQRGGRIGVVAHDLRSGRTYAHRADERFAMCSTFKWLLGAVILSRVEAGLETLSRPIDINESDLVPYAPTTGPAVGNSLTVGELCAATIGNSDNPAANLLLRTMGGPDGFTRALRGFGDTVTRLDRFEPELNEAAPGDPRDTTTPRAMAESMERVLFGTVLSEQSRTTLRGWMLGSVTGATRLKAGLPEGWRLGHKTGTNMSTMNNDVGFAVPPSGATDQAILLISFLDAPGGSEPEASAVHANVARTSLDALSVSAGR